MILNTFNKLIIQHGIALENIQTHNSACFRFENEEAADLCVKKMNGRFFAGRELIAEKWGRWHPYCIVAWRKLYIGLF